MEDRAALKVSVFIFILVVVCTPLFASAYAKPAHKSLTENTFREFIELRGSSFTSADMRNAAQGSMDEDDLPRPENHFYDPVSGKGLNNWRYNGFASPVWATDILAQGNFCTLRRLSFLCQKTIARTDVLFSSPSDFSWDRAVYEYVHGDRVRAMRALGHQLHLIQDAAVPAHTRNDVHDFDEEPYEAFTESKTSNVSLRQVDIPRVLSVEGAIKELATFTNRNFLSKDTIFKHYSSPTENSLREDGGFLVHSTLGHKVARVETTEKRSGQVIRDVFLDDESNSVSSDYWNLLSREAVLYGVAVLDLFLRDVEQERQTHALLKMNKSYDEVNSFVNALATVRDGKMSLTSLAAADVYELNKDELDGYFAAAAVYGIHVPAVARESPLKDEEPNRQPASVLAAFDQAKQSIVGEPLPEGTPAISTPAQEEDIVVQVVQDEEVPVTTEKEPAERIEEALVPESLGEQHFQMPSLQPGAGGYGGGGSTTALNENSENGEVEEDNTALAAPVILTPATGTPLATTTVTFSGTGAAESLLTGTIGTTTATTTVAMNGSWSVGPFIFEEGITAVSFFQTNTGGEDSDATEMDVVVDITAPVPPTLSVLECTFTLREDGECLAGSTTVHAVWEADEDIASFTVFANDIEVATATGTSTTVSLTDQETSTLTVVAYDEAGNAAASNEVVVDVFASPIVITEVAWAGTNASADDQWLELYNRTEHELTLENMRLRTVDDSMNITLRGVISTSPWWIGRTLLIERGSDTVTTRAADLVADWEVLPTSGAELILELATSTLVAEFDRTPPVADCGGWCGGDEDGAFGYAYSMERIDTDTPGIDASNWQSNDGYDSTNTYYDSNGRGHAGNKIYGSVKQESSKGYPEFGYFCAPYTEPFEEGGAYTPTVPGNIATPNCTYLARFAYDSFFGNTKAFGALYKGVVGNATAANGHSIGYIDTMQNGDITDELEPGDELFVAIWRSYTGSSHADDNELFDEYFTGSASTTPPHSNFRVLNWVFGE